MNQKEESKSRQSSSDHFSEFGELQLNSVNEALDLLDQSLDSSHVIVNENEFTDAAYRCFNPLERAIDIAPIRSVASHTKEALVDLSSENVTVFSKVESVKSTTPVLIVEKSQKSSPNPKTKSSRPIFAPCEPFYIAPSTHFVTSEDIDKITSLVESELSKQESVSYGFFHSKCRWEGVYLSGSVRCKFEISVYKRAEGVYVVEGNRLSGDGFVFVSIYKSIRDLFDPPVHNCKELRLESPTFGRITDDLNVIRNSVLNVVSMANSGVCESQLSAAQIFCNIAADPTKHSVIADCGGVTALLKLLSVDFESCNQHAACALGKLSTSSDCQKALMNNTNFLDTLLPLCSEINSNYNNIEMRRECARVLANLSGGKSGAQQVVNSAGVDSVITWLQSVDELKDQKLRMHANRAKVSLAACCN